jgi:hypothetical protein
MTDNVASVAIALPERIEVAKAQRADICFGSIITAMQRTESARTIRHGNEYALSDGLLYSLPQGRTPDSAQPHLCVPDTIVLLLFSFYHNSPSGVHFNGIRT